MSVLMIYTSEQLIHSTFLCCVFFNANISDCVRVYLVGLPFLNYYFYKIYWKYVEFLLNDFQFSIGCLIDNQEIVHLATLFSIIHMKQSMLDKNGLLIINYTNTFFFNIQENIDQECNFLFIKI